MGMFTYVDIADNVLPDGAKGFSGWQTKDIVDPLMQLLIIDKSGGLLYQTAWAETVPRVYTGDAYICGCNHMFASTMIKGIEFVDIHASFTDGHLDSPIEVVEYRAPTGD